MTRDELNQRIRDLLPRLRQEREHARAQEDRLRQQIEQGNRDLARVRAELASAPHRLQADLQRRAQRLESDLQIFAALARSAAVCRACLESAHERFQSYRDEEPP